MRRRPLKPMSERRAKLCREAAPEREGFREEMNHQCCICGSAWETADYFPRLLEVHEMIGGGMRAATYGDRRSWLLVCRCHHEELQDRGRSPYVKQFALKLKTDPENFDLAWLHLVGGWAEGFITLRDIEMEVD